MADTVADATTTSAGGAPAAPAVPVKPGWQTTEFWISFLAVVYTTLIGTGIIPHATEVTGVVSAVAALVSALGYTWARSWVKSS